MRRVLMIALALGTVACERKSEPAPEASASAAAPVPAATAVPLPEARPTPSATPSEAAPRLDSAALNDRKDPDRLLRYYAAALYARDWDAAAKAWGRGSGVTATTLKASYDRAEPPVLELGKGQQDGGAGSLYYEAPVVLRFGDDRPERGSLVLRRVNDVDGATAEQLRWHIERSTIGAGQ
ncbi:hypothetical protein [Novosphingobium sp. JCM 18896]|uniref:hypothetical protein n=1 Tax=Novosphingobium sp. JCM 18896 TaxID=2989731 RepID=UPI0022238382|nr:hypothetical protein [Novosphingobium sp. JCM 18896]MCW1428917.1 hypothetical protein [Novosphingobium sp. JCM 18896]